MTVYEIPTQQGNQQLGITLAGVAYNLVLRWNDSNASYILDIYDATGNPIVTAIPLITGADLLAQYEYLQLGGALIAQTDSSVLPPGYTDLGSIGHLYFCTTS